jgi:hypothetical protein
MADKDDRDKSLSGGSSHSSEHEVDKSVSSGGSSSSSSGSSGGYQGARSDTPSSGRSGGFGGATGGGTSSSGSSPGGTSSHGSERGRDTSLGGRSGYGWGGGANAGRTVSAARSDTPSYGRSTGSNLPGNVTQSGSTPTISPNINTDRFGKVTSRVTNDLPTGFDPNRIGDTIRSTLNSPISYDPVTGMVGAAVQPGKINPNINTNRFGATTTATGIDPNIDPARFADPRAGTAVANTGLPTGFDAARLGGTVDPTAGVNVGRFGYDTGAVAGTAAPTTAATGIDPNIDPARFGAATTADINPARFGDTLTPTTAPATERFGPTTGFASAIGTPVGPTEAIQSATNPTGTVAAPGITDRPNTRVSLADAAKADFLSAPGFRAPTTDVIDRVRASWAAELGADNVRITGTPHGGLRTSAKGARSGRHGPVEGSALDYTVEVKEDGKWRSLDFGKQDDIELADRVAIGGMRDFGLKGYGVGNGYMGNKAIHHDIKANPKSGGFEWTGPNASSAGVSASRARSFADARSAYASAKTTTPAFETPVASYTATASDTTPAVAALNAFSGAGGNNTLTGNGTTTADAGVDPTTTSSATPTGGGTVDAAGKTVSTATPGTDNYPSQPTPAPGTSGFAPTPKGPYEQTWKGMAAALGIDAAASIHPAGWALQAGAMVLTGGDSLGTALTGAVGGKYGDNAYRPGADDRYSGDRAGGVGSGKQNTTGVNKPETIGQTPAVKPGSTSAKTTETTSTDTPTVAADFVSKYIDPVKRPTPFEKWGADFGWS